jgi:hypothetical protein
MLRCSLVLFYLLVNLVFALSVSASPGNDYMEIEWTDLETPGQGMEDVVKKYETQLEALDPHSEELAALIEKIEEEFNTLPANPAMNGKKIKLAGFITPLDVDDSSGMLKTFLLVPYFGACIHVPPPPPVMIVQVEPEEGESIHMDDSFYPVWVYGIISTETVSTELAEASYQMRNARLEIMSEYVE